MLFLGDSSVGKTSLAHMCKSGTIELHPLSTVGFDFFKINVLLDDDEATAVVSVTTFPKCLPRGATKMRPSNDGVGSGGSREVAFTRTGFRGVRKR